jgi:alpha-1,6-mannosyltransferase
MPVSPRQLPNTWKMYGWVLLSCLSYLLLGYLTARTEFYQLLLLFGLAFAAYYFLLQSPLTTRQGLLLGFFFRLLLLFAVPALSDDYFRFVWDGRLVLHGESPFAHLPAHYAETGTLEQFGLSPELFQRLNSPHYYSVYPPVCQVVFWLAALLSPDSILGSVLVMRVVLLAAEAGIFFLGLRLLPLLGLPSRQVLLYALNPLVIMELTGNLHFEALMIFFLLGALYLLLRHRTWLSAVSLGLAAGVKLLPLMFLPFLFGRLKTGRLLLYCVVVGLTLVVLFLPFLTGEVLWNMLSSVNLYFQKFEFNASFYYGARWLGFQLLGYNPIAIFGPLLSLIVFISILFLGFRYRQAPRSRLPHLWLAALNLYLLLSTTVHPWYLTTLVALAMFTPWCYPLVWSGMVVLSYSAYRTPTYEENLWLVAVQYAVVLGWMGVEWWRKKWLA